MKLNCKIAWLKTLKKKGGTDFAEDFRWRTDEQWSEIEIEKCSEKDLELLVEIAQVATEKGSKAVLQKISMFHKLRGPNVATCSACATSTHAIGEAWRTIKMGDANVMFAGAVSWGGTPSTTVNRCVQVPTLPQSSVACHVRSITLVM